MWGGENKSRCDECKHFSNNVNFISHTVLYAIFLYLLTVTVCMDVDVDEDEDEDKDVDDIYTLAFYKILCVFVFVLRMC